MSYTPLLRKSSQLAAFFALFGLVFSMTGILYAIVGKVTRFSDPQVILTSCCLIGLGLMLTLAGANFACINNNISCNRSFMAGILFSSIGILIVILSYPERWLYPTVAYALASYSLGLFLILLNIFVNCFTLSHSTSVCNPYRTGYNTEVSAGNPDGTDMKGSSVMATFAGILLASMLPAYSKMSLQEEATGSSRQVPPVAEVPPEKPYEVREPVYEEKPGPIGAGQGETKEKEQEEQGKQDETALPVITPKENLPAEDAATDAETSTAIIKAVSTAISEVSPMSPSDNEELSKAMTADDPFLEFVSMKKTNIKATDTMREASRKLLMFHYGRMLEREQGTKLGRDIEELHDMRVAAMRMRSVFQVLEEYLDMKMLDKHLGNLRTTRRALGQVRDLDVFLEKIDHYLKEQPPGTDIDLAKLTDSLHIEKAKRRGMMLIYLDSGKYGKFKTGFAKALLEKNSWNMRAVTKKGDPVPCRVEDVLPSLLYSQLARVRSYDHIVSSGSVTTLEQYHQLRIDVKILRYTLEFFREVLGQESKSLIQDLKNLQDNLGDMHDAAVALELLENFEKYGRWGVTEDDDMPNRLPVLRDPGVDNYIEYRKQELEKLIGDFPSVWSEVRGNDFSIRFSQAVGGIYSG